MAKSQIERWLRVVSILDNGELIRLYLCADYELSQMRTGPGSWDVEEVLRQQRYVNFLLHQLGSRGIKL